MPPNKSSQNKAFIWGQAARILSLLAAGFGIAALIGWLAGISLLTTFGSNNIPMAPSTALLFLLYGAALFFYLIIPPGPAARRAGLLLGAAGLFVSLPLSLMSLEGIHPQVEHLGMRIVGEISGAPIGHMSPLTGLCFIFAGFSFLLLLLSSTYRSRLVRGAFFLALILSLISAILTIAYFLGGPLLYDSGLIPPALTTSLAFITLGTALLITSGVSAWPREKLLDDSSGTWATYWLIMIFIVAATSILAAGYLNFRNYQDHLRAEVEGTLTAIAKLKTSELVRWRQERLGDAVEFFDSANFSEQVRRFCENPFDTKTRRWIQRRLDKVLQTYQYDRVYLLNTHGIEQISAPETANLAAAPLPHDIFEVLSTGQVNFLDLHRDAPDQPVHMTALVPVFQRNDHKKPLGILGLRINPEKLLYPMIRSYPIPNRSAEIELVRREGNYVLLLNNLKSQRQTALNLRFSLHRKDLPAVMAVAGKKGIVYGNDYHGVPVVAAISAVPDTPWFLVVRVNTAEVYAPLQGRLWEMMGVIIALLLGLGALTGFFWRSREARFYRECYKSAEALRESELRYRSTLDDMLEGFQIIDNDWRYLYLNKAALVYGRQSREALLGHTVMECYPGFVKTRAFGAMRHCMVERLSGRIEDEFVYADGSRAWFEFSMQPIKEGLAVLSIDVSARKKAESRIEHLNRVLRAMRDVSQLVVREANDRHLIQQACELLVKHRGYQSAMIVLTDKEGRPTAYSHAGLKAGSQPLFDILERHELSSLCSKARPQDKAPVVLGAEDVCANCPLARQHDAAQQGMCVALLHGGASFGRLTVTMEQGAQADGEELNLFVELAGDIAYGLHNMAVMEGVKRAEKEREELKTQLVQAQKMEAVGLLAGGVAHDFNNMLQVILGNAQLGFEDVILDPRVEKAFQEIRKAARRSADLTRQLLAFARKQTIAPEILDFNATIDSTLKMLGRLIGEDIDLLWRPGTGVWPVKMDPAQLDQILANLAVNARDAIAGVGKITIETRNVEFDENYCQAHLGFLPGRYVMLAVSDNGIGMDRSTLEHIFEPFFTTKTQGRGTGLGLATIYGIVKQNKGFINVYSEPVAGTTFKIYLPRHGATGQVYAGKLVPDEKPTGTETILVVEDEISLLQLSARLLKSLGYTVLMAASPEEAINIVSQSPETIHLLMTDVIMPVMSGRELWQKLRALRPDLKCLFMSGYTADVISHHGVLDQGVHFLQKPFSVNRLAQKIREVLRH